MNYKPVDEVVCSTRGCNVSFGVYPRGMEAVGHRARCPKCGRFERTVLNSISAELTPLATLGYEGFPPGTTSKRRRFAWGLTGWELSKSLQRLVKKTSLFDKRSNRRYEHVGDPVTGEVLYHQDHPLTEHIGHGSDKSKNL